MVEIDRRYLQAWQGFKDGIRYQDSLNILEIKFRHYVHATIQSPTYIDCGPAQLLRGFWYAVEKIEEISPVNPLYETQQTISMPSFTEPIRITPATHFIELIYAQNYEHKPACDYALTRVNPHSIIKMINLASLFSLWRNDPNIKNSSFREKIQKNTPLINKWLTHEIEEKKLVPLMRLAVVNRWLGKQCKVNFPDLHSPPIFSYHDPMTNNFSQQEKDFKPTHLYTLAEIAEIRRKIARDASPRTR